MHLIRLKSRHKRKREVMDPTQSTAQQDNTKKPQPPLQQTVQFIQWCTNNQMRNHPPLLPMTLKMKLWLFVMHGEAVTRPDHKMASFVTFLMFCIPCALLYLCALYGLTLHFALFCSCFLCHVCSSFVEVSIMLQIIAILCNIFIYG